MTQKEIDYARAVQRALAIHTSQEEADKATAEMYKASREMLEERKIAWWKAAVKREAF